MHVLSIVLLCLPVLAMSKNQRDSESSDSYDGLYFDTRSTHNQRSSASNVVPKQRSSNTRSPSHSQSSSLSSRWSNTDIWTGPSSNQVQSSSSSSSSPSSNGLTPLAEHIKCSDKAGVQLLTATITPPPGFANVPVFEEAVSINPSASEECSMRHMPGTQTITFSMKVSNFLKCGVTTQKASDGKEWLAISIRFPYVGGLRTAEDEHVMIMCRPQERTVTKSHAMDLRSNLSSMQRTVFSSGPAELETKVSMFTKKSPTSGSFSEELSRNSLIEVGQDLQFRALVRSGDGWRAAKLKDLTIQKISSYSSDHPNGRKKGSAASASNLSPNRITSSHPTPDSALLVMEDGCRNPVYAAIAPKHPISDPSNPLVVNFAFKAFMFQDMLDGDTLRITAKIMACQEPADCQPGLCLDDELGGYGRRRRRRRSVPLHAPNNQSSSSNTRSGKESIHDWTRDFELNVVMPGYVKAYASTTSDERPNSQHLEDMIMTTRTAEVKCRHVVFLTAVMSGVFVIVTTIAATVALRAKQQMIDKYYGRNNDMTPSTSSVPSVQSLPSSQSTGHTTIIPIRRNSSVHLSSA